MTHCNIRFSYLLKKSFQVYHSLLCLIIFIVLLNLREIRRVPIFQLLFFHFVGKIQNHDMISLIIFFFNNHILKMSQGQDCPKERIKLFTYLISRMICPSIQISGGNSDFQFLLSVIRSPPSRLFILWII